MSKNTMTGWRTRSGLLALMILSIFLLSSCISVSLSKAPTYKRNRENPYRSLAYPVPFQPAVRGTIHSNVRMRAGIPLFPSPAPSQGAPLPQVLSVSGTIQKQLISGSALPSLLLPGLVTDSWKWSGTISHGDMKQEVEMIVEFTHDQEGGNRQFHVEEAVAGECKLVPSSQYGDFAEAVPFRMFTASDGTCVYKVFLTMDRNWTVSGEHADDPIAVEANWPKTGIRLLFTMEGQTLQFLDQVGQVVAELQDSEYRLYVPENDTRHPGLVTIMGLVATYRAVISALDSAEYIP